jgi:hypothetical protein
MSLEVRQWIVAHPNALFRTQLQRDDILDETKIHTNVIAIIQALLNKNHIIEFTALCSDHHDDSYLNPPTGAHTHAGHDAFDCWFNSGATLGNYLDASDYRFQQALKDTAALTSLLYQIGLAGEANILCDRQAAGSTEFTDDGGDHVHIGAQ